MKINKNRLKEILLEEIAAVAEAAGHRGNPNKPWDAFFPPSAESDAMRAEKPEEHTPMMPPKPVKIDPADMYEVSAAVRKFAAEAEGGDRDILEKAAEILQLHSGVLEEGEEAIEEGHYNKDPRPCANDERYQPPNRNDYRQYGKCVKK